MQDVMLMVATVTPVEDLLEKLQEAIQEAKADPCDDTFKKVEFNATMFLMNRTTKGNVDKVMDVIEDMDRTLKAKNLVKPSSN